MLTVHTPSVDFARCFANLKLEAKRPVIVAVSGGSDSTALLLGLQTHFSQTRAANEIIAVTIDHGLRPEAEGEALEVARFCEAQNVRHMTKKWEPGYLSSGVQAAARDARYRLLTEAALEFDAQMVLTGHTLDDQIETVLMRKSRGAGRGLAGIARATLYQRSVWFVRPLLDCSRASLRSYLAGRQIDWVDDPSNEDLEFERVRIRNQRLTDADRQNLLTEQSVAQQKRASNAKRGGALILDPQKAGIEPDGNSGWLNLSGVSDDGFETALQAMLCKIGDRSHFAAQPVIDQIFSFVRAGKKAQKFTAQGCLLSIDHDRLQIRPEARSVGTGQYGFDHLLSCMDLYLANSVNYRLKRPEFPPLPLKNATC